MPDKRKTQDGGRLTGATAGAVMRAGRPCLSRGDLGMAVAETSLPDVPQARAAGDPALDTFPKLLLDNAQRRGQRPAIREKDYGIWQSWSWGQVAREVQDLALGLAAM